MSSKRIKEICYKMYLDYASRFPNCKKEDLFALDELLTQNNYSDRDYLGIVIGMEYAYESEICHTFRERFFFSYGFNEYFKNVKSDSLESDDSRLHDLEPKDRYFASYGYMKAYEELRKGMKEDGLIEVKKHEKSKR